MVCIIIIVYAQFKLLSFYQNYFKLLTPSIVSSTLLFVIYIGIKYLIKRTYKELTLPIGEAGKLGLVNTAKHLRAFTHIWQHILPIIYQVNIIYLLFYAGELSCNQHIVTLWNSYSTNRHTWNWGVAERYTPPTTTKKFPNIQCFIFT